jgi:hypothetical protein
MPYTDTHGRPEIIADPGLKRGPAAYRIDTAPAAATARADGDADRPGTGGAALSWPYCEHAC